MSLLERMSGLATPEIRSRIDGLTRNRSKILRMAETIAEGVGFLTLDQELGRLDQLNRAVEAMDDRVRAYEMELDRRQHESELVKSRQRKGSFGASDRFFDKGYCAGRDAANRVAARHEDLDDDFVMTREPYYGSRLDYGFSMMESMS